MKEVHLYENTKISTEGNTCTYSMLTCQTICSLVAELLTLNLTLNYGKMYCRHLQSHNGVALIVDSLLRGFK